MSLLESTWFLISFLVITVVLLIDPKSSLTDSNTSGVLGMFSSPNSGQQFIYNVSAVLILLFFVLSTILSLDN